MMTLSDDFSPKPVPAFVTYLNAACFNIAADDLAYRRILEAAEGVYADGKAIVWASQWLGNPVPERVNAADFIIQFCHEAAARKKRVYLLGSPAGVAEGAAARFCREVPGLDIAGTQSGYFGDEEVEVKQRIAAAAPDFLLIGMGVPLQEKWAWENREILNARVIWCVGAMFEFYAGHRRRAPQWMCKAGLEWLFRLLIEPRRMWKRYLIGNARYIWRVLFKKRVDELKK